MLLLLDVKLEDELEGSRATGAGWLGPALCGPSGGSRTGSPLPNPTSPPGIGAKLETELGGSRVTVSG